MPEEKKLTAKQRLFCENYVANGYKLQKAYMDAYPDANPATANKEAWKLMKREPIHALIDELQHERFEALHISADKIAAKLAEMAFADKNDEVYTPAIAAKALDMLQKQLGLQSQKIDAKVDTFIKVDIEDDKPTSEE